MARIPNMVMSEGRCIRMPVAKRVRDTVFDRAGRCAAEAIARYRAKYFAMRWGGQWHIYAVDFPHPVRTDLSSAAAEMWLRHRRG